MYLHIGKNYAIKNNSIIGIFSYDNIKNTREFKGLYENMSNKIIDISEKQPKSFILIEKDNEVLGYVTNIGTNTIKKRKMQF